METIQLSTEQILSAVPTLNADDLERLFQRVLKVKAERNVPHHSAQEAALLARVNESTPAPWRERFNQLTAKREEGVINDEEYAELTRLNDAIEVRHAERVGAMVELAQLRGVTLPALMDQLGIHFPENA
jgi:hypothetical protein